MIEILERIVWNCGKLVKCLKESALDIGTSDKPETLGQHFSTDADQASLELGMSMFAESGVEIPIIAEDLENTERIPKNCIVFDALDGTANYFNGSDFFSVTACQFAEGLPVCGATYFPASGLLINVVKGRGSDFKIVSDEGLARRSAKFVTIEHHGFIDKSQIGTDVGSWTHRSGTFETMLRPLSERFNILSSMAATEGMRQVLFGQTGAYYNFGVAKIWDAAAMALAIQEAGGVVVGPDGGPVVWDHVPCDWIAAVNQKFADIILEHSCKLGKIRRY